MLNPSRIKAITLDLDDTLWPIWPTITRAETALTDWLADRAPATVALLAVPDMKRQIRAETEAQFAHLAHDLGVIRREAIRLALQRAGDNPGLAEPAFEVFFEARHQVELFADALPALEALSARYPLVALTNGNADIGRVGLARYFKAALSAREFGVGKPDPRIFHAAAALVGAAPEHTLHVGDDAHLDGVGGLGAGMQFAWVNRAGHPWDHAPHQPHLTIADLNTLVERLA
jgi:putative hydrolase of the HAD superfamily